MVATSAQPVHFFIDKAIVMLGHVLFQAPLSESTSDGVVHCIFVGVDGPSGAVFDCADPVIGWHGMVYLFLFHNLMGAQ